MVVAATAWNRVDAFSLPGGRLVTERGPTSYSRGEDRPEHYLDYFHGALHVSPDGSRVLDDGWVWHPVGIPVLWHVTRWLDGDTWQAEAPRRLLYRSYLWDTPMCWVGDQHVAIWGVGDDDEAVIPGVCLVDVERGGPSRAFAGVARDALWSDGRLLFSRGDTGLSVWDPFTGERLAELVGFIPSAYNPFTDEFLVKEGQAVQGFGDTPSPSAG